MVVVVVVAVAVALDELLDGSECEAPAAAEGAGRFDEGDIAAVYLILMTHLPSNAVVLASLASY